MFRCLICKENFSSRSIRDTHRRKSHTYQIIDPTGQSHVRNDDGLFKCTFCPVCLDDCKSFKRHLEKHYASNAAHFNKKKKNDPGKPSIVGVNLRFSNGGVTAESKAVVNLPHSDSTIKIETKSKNPKKWTRGNPRYHFNERNVLIQLNGPMLRHQQVWERVIRFVELENQRMIIYDPNVRQLKVHYALKFDYGGSVKLEAYLFEKLSLRVPHLIDLKGSIKFALAYCAEENNYKKELITRQIRQSALSCLEDSVLSFIKNRSDQYIFEEWVKKNSI